MSTRSQDPSIPPALPGRRREMDGGALGRLSWYQDEPPGVGAGAVPLLLVHSVNAAASAYEVRPLYEHYRRLRPVYAIDLPGYGFSSCADRAYTPRLMTDALHALTAQICRERAVAAVDGLAVSLSAEFLARAAVERPAQYLTLALVNPTGFNRERLLEGPAESTRGRPGVLALLRRPGIRRRIFALLTRRGVIRYFLRRTYGSREIDEGLLEYDYLTTRPAGAEFAPLHFLSGFLFSGDSGTVYRGLRQPVWLVHGVRGDFVKFTGTRAFAAAPNWTMGTFESGALPYFERTTEFIVRYDAWRAAL